MQACTQTETPPPAETGVESFVSQRALMSRWNFYKNAAPLNPAPASAQDAMSGMGWRIHVPLNEN